MSGASLAKLYGRVVTMSPRQLAVAGQQRRVEALRQRNVGGVVGGERIAQLPETRQQVDVGMAFDDEREVIVESLRRASRVDLLEQHQAPQGLRHLYIYEVRCVQELPWVKRAGSDTLAALALEQKLQSCRGIDDDQRLSRSARNTSVGDWRPR